MPKHQRPCRGVQCVSKDGYQENDGEYENVESEKRDTEGSQRAMVTRVELREGIEQDRDDACTHCDGELGLVSFVFR